MAYKNYREKGGHFVQSASLFVHLLPFIVIAFIVYFLIKGGTAFGNLFSRFGFSENKDYADAVSKSTDSGSPFNPNLFLANGSVTSFFEDDCQKMCDAIKGAYGFFTFDFSVVIAQFKKCRTKVDVSYLCFCFNRLYGRDLLQFLNHPSSTIDMPWDVLSSSQLSQIINYCNSLS